MNIKKNLLVTLLFLGFTLIVGNFSYAKDYEYKKLDIKADVNIDGTIDVKEIFTTNFLERRHGIVRSIPLDYTVDDTKFLLDISDINVEGSNFSFEKQNGNLEIKIGDGNKTVIGEQIYPISYSAYGLIRNFSGMGYSELYWNLVGYEIDTDVAYLKAELKLPKYNLFTDEDFLITVDGESSSVNDFKGKIDWSEGDKIMIVYDKKLYVGDGITLAIRFPNDYFEFEHDKQSRLLYIDDSKGFEFDYKNLNSTSKVLIYTLGFLIFFFGIMYVSKNWLNRKIKPVKICKDFNSKYPVIVQFTPPKGINSAEAGLLFNCRVDPVDMTSLFYQWVNDKIIEIKCGVDKTDSKKINSITFVKLKDIPEDYPYYEKELFYNLFKNKDSKYVTENSDLSRVVSLEGLEDFGLHKHWLCRRKHLSFLWIILSIIFVALLVLGFYYFKWLGALFLIFLLPLFCGIAYKQNNKVRFTNEGGKLAAHVVGYAKFIEKCDENQLKTFLEKDPLFIDKTIPYAVAFGMETQFLKKVTPLLKDIEQTWLKGGKSGVSFPVGDVSSFMKNILGNVQLDRNLVSFGLNTINGGGNYKKSNTNLVKHSGDYLGKNWDYSEIKGFDIGSIFAGGGKFFKKGGGGGGGGTKSW